MRKEEEGRDVERWGEVGRGGERWGELERGGERWGEEMRVYLRAEMLRDAMLAYQLLHLSYLVWGHQGGGVGEQHVFPCLSYTGRGWVSG